MKENNHTQEQHSIYVVRSMWSTSTGRESEQFYYSQWKSAKKLQEFSQPPIYMCTMFSRSNNQPQSPNSRHRTLQRQDTDKIDQDTGWAFETRPNFRDHVLKQHVSARHGKRHGRVSGRVLPDCIRLHSSRLHGQLHGLAPHDTVCTRPCTIKLVPKHLQSSSIHL